MAPTTFKNIRRAMACIPVDRPDLSDRNGYSILNKRLRKALNTSNDFTLRLRTLEGRKSNGDPPISAARRVSYALEVSR
jgi:hypothetical protein